MTKTSRSLLLMTLASPCLALPCAHAQTPPAVETIDERQVESLTLRQPASPFVVVFEGGSRNTLDKWGALLTDVSREATVFAYNRPGYGNSEPVATSRDGRTIVEELRRLLHAKGLQPPYVLVGHSLGGLYMQLFARAHPDEVKGLVLVDALYPRTVKRSDDFPWATRVAGRLLFSRTVWREIEQIDTTGEAVLALPGIDAMPIMRLVNVPKPHPGEMPPVPVDFGATRTDRASIELVRNMYPKAKTVILDSDHQMALSTPEPVIKAIHEVLAEPSRMTTVAR
ncbi:alpha/beta fold hydrolase [Massilia sp. 9096]|uniref:alpha/beta fold hydrolase n=1 Tax=Massilia sp. 9096 TaxID=1500894 RepID=UPI00056461C4|nr:alpha/beta hydrolase family protein [Massilia sp. 9096]